MKAPRVVVVGPGRVGIALAGVLADLGDDVTVVGRGQAVPPATLVLVAVPDDVLVAVVRAAAAADAVYPGSRWVHVAGAYGLGALVSAAAAGARVAACHPAVSFPDAETGRAALPGAAWAVTASGADLDWAQALVRRLGGEPVAVADRDRTLYHAALALASNATAGVVALARDLLLGAGIHDPELFLAPLASASAAGAAARGVAALIGPVRRGDAGTVARHLGELDAVFPEAAVHYRALARLLVQQAVRAGLDPAAAASVAEVLGEDGASLRDRLNG